MSELRLLNAKSIAKMLGINYSYFCNKFRHRNNFPKPLTFDIGHDRWTLESVENWIRARQS